MPTRLPLLLSLLLLSWTLPAAAQLQVHLKLGRPQHLTGEPVLATVTITNRSGRELFLRSNLRGNLALNWLDFEIRDGQGKPLSRRTNAVFRAVQIPPGQSVARQVNLSRLFDLGRPNSLSVLAKVREGNGENPHVYRSNSERLYVSDGRVLFEQPYGVPDSPVSRRKYQLVAFNDGQRTSLYVSIVDLQRNRPLTTFRLSEALLFQKPQAALDSKNRLHTLYLANPDTYVHITVNPEASRDQVTYYRRGGGAHPRLMALSNGDIAVAGGVKYDPAAARKAAGKARKVTDRPQ